MRKFLKIIFIGMTFYNRKAFGFYYKMRLHTKLCILNIPHGKIQAGDITKINIGRRSHVYIVIM